MGRLGCKFGRGGSNVAKSEQHASEMDRSDCLR